ncbi:hypothetical protein FWG76_00565 [Candidatus Saccharibacteria bacterium]|nr:hypothetical protein [Candidatus Saccharibacteria bacterium]
MRFFLSVLWVIVCVVLLVLAFVFLFPIIAFAFAVYVGVFLALMLFGGLFAAIANIGYTVSNRGYNGQNRRQLAQDGIVYPTLLQANPPYLTANPTPAASPANVQPTTVIITSQTLNLNDILAQINK